MFSRMGTLEIITNNDDFVDNLMKFQYIKRKEVELAFRAVDRANYLPPWDKQNAYRNCSLKYGKIHLSAPYVYTEVMEGLCLKPGLSFLNIGSGTGYVSTMAGLILNQHGINHGVELYEECLKYAYERLEEFKQKSLALDEFDFCEPLFVQGDCLNVIPDRQYDRVYCGAAWSESYIDHIKQFVRPGGILVIHLEDTLICTHRTSRDIWYNSDVIPIPFESIVVGTNSEQTPVYLPECHPLSLRELCRGNIRNRLRENVWNEHSSWLETKKLIVLEQEDIDIGVIRVEIISHHVNSKALSTYMMEKIHQLPLPFSLKLYINYNRQL
ncbi:protein-L-isoaspartate O-methyltransferase domain-containing protein 1 [Colletes latitarsis]|uniref:protein-L-isoaspartate O-methyltransferase domain-containing protein 1 n=1 Tax=Colletes latitarsis TaxID=2605962 RepID=UPI004035F075